MDRGRPIASQTLRQPEGNFQNVFPPVLPPLIPPLAEWVRSVYSERVSRATATLMVVSLSYVLEAVVGNALLLAGRSMIRAPSKIAESLRARYRSNLTLALPTKATTPVCTNLACLWLVVIGGV